MRNTIVLLIAIACGSSVARAHAVGPPGEWTTLEILGQRIAPGDKGKFAFSTERTFEGAFLDIPVFAAHGGTPGLTLCVTSGIHGDEINSVEIARRAFAAVDAKRLKGTLIVLPVINASGFRTMQRYMPDRRDLNRAFPGSTRGSVAAIVAGAVFENVVKRCDRLVDLHTGSNYRTNMAQIRVDVKDAHAFELAKHFGSGIIVAGAGPNGSLRREATKAGVPAIIYESGPPYVFVEKEIETGVEGLLNVLDFLEMYEGGREVRHCEVLTRSTWVRVPRGKGGIYLPSVRLGDRVGKGDLLATVTDPLTDEAYRIVSDVDGLVVGGALPQVVLSGYGLFHIGQVEQR
jgi:predicted deacylase